MSNDVFKTTEDKGGQVTSDIKTTSSPDPDLENRNEFSMEAVGDGLKSLVRGVSRLLQDISHPASAPADARGDGDALLSPRPFGVLPNPRPAHVF